MDIEYLKEFIALSTTLNYLEAAENLFISQPTLTRHIQALESELGAPLFIRTPRKVELSDFGTRFLPYALKIINIQERYNAEMLADIRREKKVVVVFGGAMAPYDVASILSKFKVANPDIVLEVIRPVGQFEMLRKNECDFLLSSEYMIPKNEFHSVPFINDTIVAVVSVTHRLSDRSEIDLSELHEEKLMLQQSNAFEDSLFMKACRQAGINPKIEITDGNNMIDFAALGQYVAIMAKAPASFFADSSVKILKINPEVIQRGFFLYRKSPKLSTAQSRFLSYIRLINNSQNASL